MALKRYYSLKEKEKYYTCYTINSIADLQSVMSDFDGKRMVFRGVKEASYYNYPSALVRGIQLPQQEYDNLIAASIDAVWSNKRIEKLLLKQAEDDTDMQALSLLQHYGFGTTILDFTYKFNYAVFFALDGLSYFKGESIDKIDIDDYFSIYMFDINDAEHSSIQNSNIIDLPRLEAYDKEAKNSIGESYKGPSESTRCSFCNIPYKELARIKGGITIAGRYGGRMYYESQSTGIYVTYDVSNDRSDMQVGLFKLSPSASMSYEEAALQNYSQMYSHLFCLNIHKSLKSILGENYLIPFNIRRETVYPKSKLYNKVIRELLKIPFDPILVPPKQLVNLKPCTYDRLRKIARKRRLKELNAQKGLLTEVS